MHISQTIIFFAGGLPLLMMGAFATVCDFGNHATVRMAFVEAAFLVGFGLGENMCVEFDQRTSASHTICCSKSSFRCFSCFFMLLHVFPSLSITNRKKE